MEMDLPRIYLLPRRLKPDELHELEDRIPSLTYNIDEAEVVLGLLSSEERASFELRCRNVFTVPLLEAGSGTGTGRSQEEPACKRRRLGHDVNEGSRTVDWEGIGTRPGETTNGGRVVRVLKLKWLTDSLQLGNPLPFHDYILYEGRVVTSDPGLGSGSQHKSQSPSSPTSPKSRGEEIMARALADQASHPDLKQDHHYLGKRASGRLIHSQPPSLTHQTTSEHDLGDDKNPPIPLYLRTTFSCQRPTPINPENEEFIEQLKKIRTTRKLAGDQIGVRAYSTAIATVAAYPYPIKAPPEVARLPGCGAKFAQLYYEWKTTGRVTEVEAAKTEPRLSVTALFYDIWGVGDATAREFYNKGWRDLDDVVEYGWSTLTRVQKIGVKYYDEFQQPIPRAEVEAIGNIILRHARGIDPGFELMIVGGYRRGKERSGDVDVVVSHPDERETLGFVEKIVVSLERTGHVTHTLTLSMHNSERDQVPISWKGNASGGLAGTGFDTLDKALVVWQEPEGSNSNRNNNGAEARARPHRRVDIIVSPWKTVGCAVLGWSGGTTFQRDVRRYCKLERGLKFDSSGIRSRSDGSWVNLEGGGEQGPAPDMETAEKRVFEGLGLDWRPPWERCTG